MDERYTFKTGYDNMNVVAIHRYLSEDSYWAKGIPLETVEGALRHSFCLGVFEGEEQIGFARLVTDYHSFGYLADVYVLEDRRGQGLSKRMMEYLLALEWMPKLRRVMLATRDAHGLYEQFGFRVTERPDRLMEITRPGMYRQG